MIQFLQVGCTRGFKVTKYQGRLLIINGDLYLRVNISPHKTFEIDGDNLRTTVPLSLYTAVLGGDVEVPTIDGVAKLTIPSGIQSGELLRMRGLGLPELHGSVRGDQLVRVVVWTPTDLSSEQKHLLEQLADVEESAPEEVRRGAHKGFWSKVKEAFTGG